MKMMTKIMEVKFSSQNANHNYSSGVTFGDVYKRNMSTQ